MVFEKCFPLTCGGEKHVLFAFNNLLSTWKLSGSTLQRLLHFKLDSQIKFIEILPQDLNDLIFLISSQMEWAILSSTLQILSQNSFSIPKPLPEPAGCYYYSKRASLLLSLKPNTLTVLSIKSSEPLKLTQLNLQILEDTHWPSGSSMILSISSIRGAISKDFADRPLFCFLLQYQDYCCVQFAAVDEISKELIPGPWSVKFLPLDTSGIFTVHSAVIALSGHGLYQFQLQNERTVELECEKVNTIMAYSDKCNRILCVSGAKLMWLHVSSDNIKISLAAGLPVSQTIHQLISLAASTTVTVLCYSKFNESLVIAINLKSLTVGEICRWPSQSFYPTKIISDGDCAFIISENKVKYYTPTFHIVPYSKISIPAIRFFRVGESTFIISCSKSSSILTIDSSSIKPVSLKDFISTDRTILAQKINEKILQITTEVINVIGTTQIFVEGKITAACAFGRFIAVAFGEVVKVFKDLQVIKVVEADGEVLSIDNGVGGLVIAVKGKGLMRIDFEMLAVSKVSEYFPMIPTMYYLFQGCEIVGNDKRVIVRWQGHSKTLKIFIFRVFFLKETVKHMELFLEGIECSYILTLPSFELRQISCFDLLWLHTNIYLSAESAGCLIGPIHPSFPPPQPILFPDQVVSITSTTSCLFLFTASCLLILSTAFTTTQKIPFSNITSITCSKLIGNRLYFSHTSNSNYYLSSVDLATYTITPLLSTEDPASFISYRKKRIIVGFVHRVLIFDINFKEICEIKFPNQEFEELGKRLSDEDIASIFALGITARYRKIIEFELVNTGRNELEKRELRAKEFVCVTEEGIHWGEAYTGGFRVYTSETVEGCSCFKVKGKLVYLLADDKVEVCELRRFESVGLVMNSGHVDWRTYKIERLKRIEVGKALYLLSLSQEMWTIVNEDGEFKEIRIELV